MISVILPEVARELRRRMNLTSETLGIRSNRKPPPTAGDLYVAIYGTEIGSLQPDINTGIDFEYSMGITVTRRTQYNPYDTVDEELYMKDVLSMELALYRAIGWIHLSFDDLLARFNERVATINAAAPAYIEPFRFRYCDAIPTNVNEQWFRPEASLAAAVTPSQDYPYCGMIMEAVLGGCRRVLKLSDLQSEVGIV